MNSLIISHLRTSAILAVALLTTGATCAHAHDSPCSSPAYRQFDFWLGDWDLYEKGANSSTARVRVDRILDGCVLREHYEDKTGAVGESFTTYDTGRKLWHQTWVTNRARLLTIEGRPQDGSMVLTGAYYLEDGNEVRVRGIWTPVNDGVRESAVISDDAGKIWKPWFDLLFKHRVQSEPNSGDAAEEVAKLDEQFQAAVKANNAATIEKILADDFVLVTGSGKTFNKQQTLEEARSRSTIYEHQEDAERTVRIWGDTAVVTAKLWVKGLRDGKPIDYTLWFSDTYVRTASGWRYAFGQASLPLTH